jgi:hypothetical protein
MRFGSFAGKRTWGAGYDGFTSRPSAGKFREVDEFSTVF